MFKANLRKDKLLLDTKILIIKDKVIFEVQ